MTTDELNAIIKAVMDELEKAGVDFDFKAETPQADDLVYVMRGTADKYLGITVKWQNLLDIIVQKATEARDDAISAKDIALKTLATIQGIESNVSSMKSSVETSEANVASMKASVETSETNVTQMKSDVSTMKTSVEGTKTDVEGLKSDVTNLKSQTQTIVDNAKEEVTGLLDTKVDYTDSLTYEEIMANNIDLTNKVASASSVKNLGDRLGEFRYFKSIKIETSASVTIDNFESNKSYLIINMHYNSHGIYVLSCLEGRIVFSNLAGANIINMDSSTSTSATFSVTSASYLAIYEVGYWR